MKITIISIGKFENSPHKAVFETYLQRMKWKVSLKELELKNSQNLSVEKIKELEGDLIFKTLRPSSKLIALDEHGKQFSSRAFEKILSDYAVNGSSDFTFVIGGADGLSKFVLEKASLKLSLGLITLPHLMVRSILIEQLYRAFTITTNHPYHRD